MKKALVWIIICAVTVSGFAMAESRHYRFGFDLIVADTEYAHEMDIYTDGGMMSVISSMFPGICLQEPAEEFNLIGLDAYVSDGRVLTIVKECVDEWIAYLQPETETGFYTGDAFERAGQMEYAEFSAGDLTILLQRISARLTAAGFPLLPDGNDPADTLDGQNYRFELKMFDNRKYISVNVKNRQEVIMTLSADISRPEEITAVVGYGTAEKNYYHRIRLELQEHLTLTDAVYADDYRLGFKLLGEDDLIMTLRLNVEKRNETEYGFAMIFAPGNETMAPVEISGAVYTAETGRLLEADAGLTGSSDLSLHMTLDADREAPDFGGLTVFNALEAPEDDIMDKMVNSMQQTLLLPLSQVMSVLPVEYVQVILNLVE